MKFEMDPKLLAAVHSALKAVPDRKNTIPIAGMFHLEPGADGLKVTATDMDIEAAITVDCAAEFPPVCMPPYLVEAGGSVQRPAANIKIDDGRALISAGRARFAAGIMPGIDFPKFSGAFDGGAEIAGEALASIIAATADAAETAGGARYYLEGVFLQTEGGRLHAVATNGHRLHATSVPAADLALAEGIIVPTKAAQAIERMAAKAGGVAIRLETSASAIRVTAGNETLSAKLIDGTYPDWRRVMVQPTGVTATFDLAEMLTVIDRVMKIQAGTPSKATAKSATGPGLKLAEDDGFVTVSTHGGTDEATDAVPAEIAGKWGARGVSARYLRATLASMKERGADTVTIDSADAGSPMRIESPTDEDFAAIVMPMRIK